MLGSSFFPPKARPEPELSPKAVNAALMAAMHVIPCLLGEAGWEVVQTVAKMVDGASTLP